MPEELEKFLMKPPRRKVYTIGSNINFSMQFYKEDDSLAVDEEQEAGIYKIQYSTYKDNTRH